VELLHPGAPFVKEFAVRLPRPAALVVDELVDHGILAGIPLSDVDGHALLIAVTEKRDRDEIDRFADALREVVA
jgi:glycine dehydrogenase subunit 1